MSASPNRNERMAGLLRPGEVCPFLGIGRRTLWRWVAARVVPESIRFNARVVRWTPAAIEALANPSKSN